MIYTCVLISLLVTLIATSWIWVPVVIFTAPLWIGGLLALYILLKALGLWKWVTRMIGDAYDWLMFRSDKPRKYIWQKFYNFLCWMFPQGEWKTMNYGYAVHTETGHTIVLDPDEETERFSYQLYHYMATGFKKFPNLQGMDIVEVGSGRGGGLAYVVKYLKPKSALGVDYSKQQVSFCNETYNKVENLKYVWGDAENLPISDGVVDLVLNVESSHCYGNQRAFVAEVERILKPGGHFLITDFMATTELGDYEEILKSGNLEMVTKNDVTENVLMSLKLDSNRRLDLIQQRTPRFLHSILKKFSGVEGSNIYNQLESQDTVYVAYHLVKKKE